MKIKVFAGLVLALILSACPTIAELSFAASLHGTHSCCPADSASKNLPGTPASGDCCMRALANAPAFPLAPQLRIVFAALGFDQLLAQTPRLFAHDAPDSSPPREPDLVDSRSSRAPPAVPA